MICHDGEDAPEEVQKNPSDWIQEEDVLDTWFSSALWPFSTLGWPEKTADLKKFYPTSTLVTGHDILFFWVARMMMMGEFAMHDIPFHETFLHGLIYGKSYWRHDAYGQAIYVSQEERVSYDLGKTPPRDVNSKWEKMSKTKGNVIDPLEIINTYGADAMRMALLSALTHARQIDLDRRRFEEFKNFANKLWNSARFVFMNLQETNSLPALTSTLFEQGLHEKNLRLEDRWILSLLNKTIVDTEKHLCAYEFDKASQLLYSFFWDKFCAYYVEIAKPILFGKTGTPVERENKQKILAIVLLASIRLMHPFVPFITEEIFQKLKAALPSLQASSKQDTYTQEACTALSAISCMVSPYPKAGPTNPVAEEDFERMNSLLYHIRNIRGEMQLAPNVACDVYIVGSSTDLIKDNEVILSSLVKLKQIVFTKTAPDHLSFAASARVGEWQIIIPLPEEMKEKERNRLTTHQEKLEMQLKELEAKLANKEFTERAPQSFVENTRKTLTETQGKLQEIQEKLSQL